MSFRKDDPVTWFYLCIMLVLIYVAISMNYYWATHPSLTQMQLWLNHFVDAVMWR